MRLLTLLATAALAAPALAQPASIMPRTLGAGDVAAAQGYASAKANAVTTRGIREWGAACDGVADDSAAVAAAMRALRGTGTLAHVPGDCRLRMGPAARLAGSPATLDATGLAGEGTRDTGEGGAYGTRGGTVLLADTGGPAFIVKRNWTLDGLAFFWPGQVEDAQAPRTMPPLLAGSAAAGQAASEVSQGRFTNNDVVNAWVLADFSQDVAGGLQVRGNRGFCLSACFKLSWMPLESFVSDNQWTPNAYFSAPGVGVGPTFRLRDYAAANAALFDITGDGTAAQAPSHTVDGLVASGNYAFGMGYAVRLRGGGLNVSSLTGNGFDGVARVLSVEAGGVIEGSRIQGGTWSSYTYGSAAVTPAVYAAPDAGPGNALVAGGVTVGSVTGPLLDWSAPASAVSLSDIYAPGLNNTPGGTASGLRLNVLGGRFSITGGTYAMQGSGSGPCIDLVQPGQVLSVVGVQFITCGSVIKAGGTFPSTAVTVTGNTSVATRGGAVYAGPMAAYLPNAGNTWDTAVPGWSSQFRPSDGATVFSFGGTPKLSMVPDGSFRASGAVTPNTTP